MALQCLNQFESFEIKPFLADKDLCFVDKKEWKDYQTKKHLGFKFTFVILRDDTKYQQTGNTIKTNRYEKIDVKVAHDVNINTLMTWSNLSILQRESTVITVIS